MKDHQKLIATRIARNALDAGLSLEEAHEVAQQSMGRTIDRDLLKSALELSGWRDDPSDFFAESLSVETDGPDLSVELPA